MRKISSAMVIVGALFGHLSMAEAATEVLRLPANSVFATAVVNDPETGSSIAFVFVARTVAQSGGPVDTIFFVAPTPDGGTVSGSGVLPQSAFHAGPSSASLDVDLNAITLDQVSGEIPENGVISIDWTATDVQRIAGNAKFDTDNGQVLFVGQRTDAPADVSGTIFGSFPSGDESNSSISIVRSAIIIIPHN